MTSSCGSMSNCWVGLTYGTRPFEKLFDATMRYVCPDLGYQRQIEWDFHVPASFTAGVTTSVPAPTTVRRANDSSDPDNDCLLRRPLRLRLTRPPSRRRRAVEPTTEPLVAR